MSAKPYEAGFFVDPENREPFFKVYGDGRKERLEKALRFCSGVVGTDNFDLLAPDLAASDTSSRPGG